MKIVKGFLAIIVGIIAGSIINAGLILLGNAIFGAPEGINFSDPASVKAHADEFTIANFISTLLAHQLGTLVGAFVAVKIAPARKIIFAIAIGIWFLLGGIYAASLIPAPIWFVITDFMLYVPFALLGAKLGDRNKTVSTNG